MPSQSTRSITFLRNLKVDVDLPATIGPLTLRTFSEAEIAEIQDLRIKATHKTIHYQDGTEGKEYCGPGPYWDTSDPGDDPESLMKYPAIDCAVPITAQGNVLRGARLDGRDRRSAIALLLLRLAGRGKAYLHREFTYFDNRDHTSGGTLAGQYAGTDDLLSVRVDSACLARLRALVSDLWEPMLKGWEGIPRDCDLAMDWFDRAFEGWSGKGVVDLFVSLEAMLLEGNGELNHRLSTNVALFLQDEDRVATAKLIKDRATERGQVVHGQVLGKFSDPKTPYAEMFDHYSELEDVVRRVLRRYLILRIAKQRSRSDIMAALRKAALAGPLPDEFSV